MAGSKWIPRRQSSATATITAPKTRTEADRARIESSNQKSRLLRLPPELRNRIYEYVLPHQQDLRSSICWNQRRIFYHYCQMFHASRQLRRESLSLFCGTNLFEIRLHFGSLHTLSIMNVLCLDPVAMNALKNLEVVSSFTCSHNHTMMPFFGCVSVFVDRGNHSVIRTGQESWTNNMLCDRNMKWGMVGEKCVRVREGHVVRLLEEVEAAGLHENDREVSGVELEELAKKVGGKKVKGRKGSTIMPKVGRAIKREASMLNNAVERYRETATFLG